jgi:hypothetical protein
MSRQHRLVRDLAAIEQQLSQLLRSANTLSVDPGDPVARARKSTWALRSISTRPLTPSF